MIAYRQPVDEVVAALDTDVRRGLSDEEAEEQASWRHSLPARPRELRHLSIDRGV
jgi:hypothetical protein